MASSVETNSKNYLRDARLQAGYASRDTAAMALNYSPETIGRHERGDVPVSADDILRYAEGYQRPDILLRYCADCPIGRVTGRTAGQGPPLGRPQSEPEAPAGKRNRRQAGKHCRRWSCRQYGAQGLRQSAGIFEVLGADDYGANAVGHEPTRKEPPRISKQERLFAN